MALRLADADAFFCAPASKSFIVLLFFAGAFFFWFEVRGLAFMVAPEHVSLRHSMCETAKALCKRVVKLPSGHQLLMQEGLVRL